jgi:hypothetical protein
VALSSAYDSLSSPDDDGAARGERGQAHNPSNSRGIALHGHPERNGTLIARSTIAIVCLNEDRKVSPTKRLFLSCAVAILVVGASAATSEAQYHRGPRVVVAGGFYYSPFYSPYWIDPWYGAGYPWGYYPPYGQYLPPDASVKLEVKPNEAEVYIDGYYAGIVDDFDGAFQRLHVAPGEHEIELYLAGYRTVTQKILLSANNTFKVKYTMEKLAAGDPPPQRPQPLNPPAAQGGPPMQQPPEGYPPMPPQRAPGEPGTRRLPPPPPPGSAPRSGQPQSGYGTLSVRVQPADAEISVDGEAWRGPAGQDRLAIELAEGSHTVEIRKPGYRTYVTQIDIRRGDTTPLNVSLRGEQQ